MKNPTLAKVLLLLYILLLIKIMVLKDLPTIHLGGLMLNFSGTNPGQHPNFIPFTTIIPYLLGHKGIIIAGINLLGNIVLLIPVGILFPFGFETYSQKTLILLAIGAGFSIELLQVILQVGIFDIDDIILNALGVLIGYGVYLLLQKWIQKKQYSMIAVSAFGLLLSGFAILYTIIPNKEQATLKPKIKSSIKDDLCGGTGGTGEIIKLGTNTLTIKRRDGLIQELKLTAFTKIQSSNGEIKASDLKVKERVTVVVNDAETASVVLVCQEAHNSK